MNWLKRIILGLVILFIIAFIGLWLASFRSNRGQFDVSVMINQPPSVVFGALIDPEMTKKWVSGVIEIKRLTPEPAHVGTKLLIIENINGRRVEMEEEITYLDPPYIDKYTSRGLGDPSEQFTEFGEYRLEAIDGKTRFTMLSKIEFHGFLYSLLEPLLIYGAREKFAGDQLRLKDLLESQEGGR